MKTELDSGCTWFLESLVYRDGLEVLVAEGFRSEKAESVKVGDKTIDGVHRLERQPHSRRFLVRFPHFVAWQIVDESCSSFDENEKRDDRGFLQALDSSEYFTYVRTNHGGYQEMKGPGKHYRFWTENEVLDVIGGEAPGIELVPDETLQSDRPRPAGPARAGAPPLDCTRHPSPDAIDRCPAPLD